MTKIKAYRHGEITFLEKKEIPKLKKSVTDIFATGSHGNNHSFKGGSLYLLEKPEQYVIGYFKAKDTKLYHPDHSPKGCSLPDGLYEIRRQVEFTEAGLVPVID